MRNSLLLVVLLILPAAQGAAETLTNASILELVRAGLSAETIRLKLMSTPASFDVSTAALVRLAGDGVPDAVVRAMIERQISLDAGEPPVASRATTQAAAVAPAPPVAAPVPAHQPSQSPTVTSAPTLTGPRGARRFEVLLKPVDSARCSAEMRVDARGITTSGCRSLELLLKWAEVRSICTAGGARGIIRIQTHNLTHEIESLLPVTAQEFGESVTHFSQAAVPVSRCG